MADITKTVEIYFTGKDDLSGSLNKVRDGFSDFGSKLDAVTSPLADIAAGVLKTEAALAAMATGALVYAVDKAIKFESAVIELDKVLSDEEGLSGSLEKAKNKAIEFSDKYGVSSTEILNSMANFKQAGFGVEDAMNLVADSMDLVIAGGLDAAEASEVLVASLKGFDQPASEAGRLIDILNEVSNKYATNVSELAKGMSGLSPIAKTMGLSMEETAGVLTPVIEVFRSGDEAAIALKTGLLKLIDDSKPVKDALASIGVSQTDANGALRSGKDILYDVMKAFTTLNPEQKLFVTQQLVGIEQAARMVTVFDNQAKVLGVTETALNSAGSAATEVAKRLESSEVAVARFKTSFENLSVAVGTKFLEATGQVVSGATSINQALREAVNEGSFDPLFKVINSIAGDIGELFKGIAEALPEALAKVDWSKFTTSIKGLADEIGDLFGALFGGLDLTDVDDLSKFIQKVIDAITGLNNVTKGILESWEPFFKYLGKTIDKLGELDGSTQETSGNVLGIGQALDKIIAPITTVMKAFDAIAISLGVMAWSSVSSAIGSIGTSASTAGGALNTFGATLSTTIGSASAGQTLGIMGLGYAAGYAVGYLMDKYVPNVNKASQATADWLAEMLGIEDVGKITKEAVDENVTILEKMRSKFGELGGELDKLSSKELVKLKVTLDQQGMTVDELNAKIKELPEEKKSEILLLLNQGKYDEALKKINEVPEGKTLELTLEQKGYKLEDFWAVFEKLPEEKQVEVKTLIQQGEVEKAVAIITGQLDKVPSEKKVEVAAKADEKSIAEAKSKLEEIEKQKLEIQAKIDVAKLETEAEKVKAAFEAMSKLGVAQIEADAQKYVAALESISSMANSVADILGGLFDLWGEADTIGEKWQIEEWIDDQLDIQKQQLELQKKLIDEQIKYYQARTSKLQSGDAMIEIKSDGLEPELEAFMWKILEKIQTRVNEEMSEYLLGVNPSGA